MTTKISCDRCDKDVKREQSYYCRYYNRSTKASANFDLCHDCFLKVNAIYDIAIEKVKELGTMKLEWKVWERAK